MKRTSAVLAVFLATSAAAGCAADWPTWRFDPCRSGASPEDLPGELHLQWVRELPPPMSAWPNEARLAFDASYEPVVAGKSLLVGSPNDGSVTAFGTESGALRWRFFSEGPVRFAPVVSSANVYFGSDDGFLYCLALRDGKLLWKARVAPNDCSEQRHLGNNRLISFWPVRGGPVLADGTLYAAAGIWPTLGVFVIALDAQNGKLRWRNGEGRYLEKVRLDHNNLRPSGLSPQGYLLVSGNKLLLPNGRSMPAVFDRTTGKLLDYFQGYRNGNCRVTTAGNLVFVGDNGVIDLRTGREVNSRWAAAGKDAPRPQQYAKADLFEATFFPYKFVPGCSARSALSGGSVYDLQQGNFLAYDAGNAKLSQYEQKSPPYTFKPSRWDPPLCWKLATEAAAAHPADSAIIRAGNRLYGHTAQTIMAVDLPASDGAAPRLAWTQKLAGTAAEVLAADRKLFVVTREGRIACLAAVTGEARIYRHVITPLAAPKEAAPRAAEILKTSGVAAGYCVLLGLGEKGLAEQLLLQSQLKLIAIDADPHRVGQLRERLVAAGLYGTRAEVFCGQPRDFSLPPYLASLLVTDYPQTENGLAADLLKQWFATLQPYGGAAYLWHRETGAGQIADLPGLREVSNLPREQVTNLPHAVLIRRVGSLPDSAPWTHQAADAAMSYFSRDRCVRPPLSVLWYGDGPGQGFWCWHDYNSGVKPQVVGGRLFALHNHELWAYDVYTGRRLWTAKIGRLSHCPPLGDGASPPGSHSWNSQALARDYRYASLDDGVYVAGSNRCVVYDPATGRLLRRYHFEVEPGRPAYVTALRVAGDVIVIAAAVKAPGVWGHLWDGTAIVALDRASGRTLWSMRAKEGFHFHAIAVGDGTVFCNESPSRIKTKKVDKAAKPGSQPPPPTTIRALEARSGKTRWSATTANRDAPNPQENTAGISDSDDWLGYCRELKILLAGKTDRTCAFGARDGKPLWQEKLGSPPAILCGERLLSQQGQFYDLRSGKRLGRPLPVSKFGCNYAVANQYLMLMRDATVSYLDLATGKSQHMYAIRSGCSNSLIAADGLLNVPCFAVGCVCNYPIQTSFALVPIREETFTAPDRRKGNAP
jgi:outer membrane protein assembly factor BamB